MKQIFLFELTTLICCKSQDKIVQINILENLADSPGKSIFFALED